MNDMSVTIYIWDVENDSYLVENDEAGTSTAVYSHEPIEFGSLISQCRIATTSFYHFDALGSTRQLSNTNECVTDANTYDAWGTSVESSGITENPFEYIGQSGYYTDTECDNIYIRRRTYQPTIARWRSSDLIVSVGREYPYVYSSNNPLNRVDPSGLLSRTHVSQETSENGGFAIRWKFSLNRAFPFAVIIIQRLAVQSIIWPCTSCCAREKILRNCRGHYYELIGFVRADNRTIRAGDAGTMGVIQELRRMGANPDLPGPGGADVEYDDTWFQPPTAVPSCGIHKMEGTVKAFRLTPNVLTRLRRWRPVVQGSSSPEICNMRSGGLAGNVSSPDFWDRDKGVFKLLDSEGPTQVRAVWDCPPAMTSFAILDRTDSEAGMPF